MVVKALAKWAAYMMFVGSDVNATINPEDFFSGFQCVFIYLHHYRHPLLITMTVLPCMLCAGVTDYQLCLQEPF